VGFFGAIKISEEYLLTVNLDAGAILAAAIVQTHSRISRSVIFAAGCGHAILAVGDFAQI
jgi:hypothetical protein